MITTRDRKIILHLGYHGWLSHEQLQKLEFPSYQTLQRRIRRELLENNWIDRKYLPDRKGNQIAIFRLTKKGKKWFRHDTGINVNIPRFSQLKVPHRLMVNELIVQLKKENIIHLSGFELEKKCGSIRPDAVVNYNEPFAIEVDLSAGETKEFICKKWRQYEREYMQGNLSFRYVVWYSHKRMNRLYEWIEKKSQLEPLFIDKADKIFKVIQHIKPGIKNNVTSL